MKNGWKHDLSRCRGVTSLEYAILVGLIAAAVGGAVSQFETKIPRLFQNVAASLGSAGGTPGGSDGGGNGGGSVPGDGGPVGGDSGDGTPGGSSDNGGPDGGSGEEDTGDGGADDNGSGDGSTGGGSDGGGSGGGSGSGPGENDEDSFVPDYTFSTNIDYHWSDTYQDWFPRPPGIPEDQWHDQPYTIDSNGDAVALTSGKKPNEMGWNGVTLRFTTPVPGETLKIRLTVGQNKILYTFTRATS